MEVIIKETSEEASALVADWFTKTIQQKPNAVLGLATGKTPLSVYSQLVANHQKQKIDFKNIRTFNLDEYVGVGPEHPSSYAHYMSTHLFSKINIDLKNTFIPNGQTKDINAECAAFESRIAQVGPIDLQLLGIGRDGHIGFNEPGSSLSSRTRLKTLTQETRDDNASNFSKPSDIPIHVITMGLGTIMEAKQIVLMAFGKDKAKAISLCVEGPVSAYIPASILQFHNCVKIVIDREAASLLKNREYYEWVYSQKPKWQKLEGS